MTQEFNKNLKKAIVSSKDTILLCKKALEDANDDSCRALYTAISKDYEKHLSMLNEEIEMHKEKKKWD